MSDYSSAAFSEFVTLVKTTWTDVSQILTPLNDEVYNWRDRVKAGDFTMPLAVVVQHAEEAWDDGPATLDMRFMPVDVYYVRSSQLQSGETGPLAVTYGTAKLAALKDALMAATPTAMQVWPFPEVDSSHETIVNDELRDKPEAYISVCLKSKVLIGG